MSRSVVLTFDYEIFFVGPATVEHCLLKPVDALLRELEAAGAHACFFVDAAHLLRMNEEPRAAGDASRVNDQIARIVAAGHRVELHVHPQWLDAAWQAGGLWNFSQYRSCILGNLRREVAVDLLVSSGEALTAAASAASRGYALQAFRAPGLCAQPFESIAEGMDLLGIAIDSSVAAGLVRHTEFHSIDYRAAPRDTCWRFGSDPIVPQTTGRFIELPITMIPMRLGMKMHRRLDRLRRPAAYRGYGDGSCMPVPPARMLSMLRTTSAFLTLEDMSPAILGRALPGTGRLVTFISHPKVMSPVSLETLRWLGAQDVRFLTPSEAVIEELGNPDAAS